MDQRRRTSHQDAARDREDNEERELRFPFIRPAAARLLPFDGAEKSRASLIVESDDDAGGGKVGVITHRRTPTQRRAENRSETKVCLLK